MTAAEFSDHVRRLARELSLEGSPELDCPPRGDRTRHAHADPLDDLIANYDTTRLASHGIDFHAGARDYQGSRAVGQYHGDVLVVHRPSGEVRLIEWGTDHVLAPVAATTARFLDALEIAVEFAARCTADAPSYEAGPVRLAYAARCGAAAGGEAYRAFYEMLLGCG